MPLITTIDAFGNPQTVQTFDHEAFARWKADQATWRRNHYATDATFRESHQAARRDT
jgi:hypothetical protein